MLDKNHTLNASSGFSQWPVVRALAAQGFRSDVANFREVIFMRPFIQ